MMLNALTEAVIQVKPWSSSRANHVRNSVAQFARMLGCASTAECAQDVYNISDDEVFRLVNVHKPDATSGTQKNIRVNIQGVLREGRRLRWIPAIENRHTITPWRQGSLHGKRVFRGVGANRSAYALKPLPPPLEAELSSYLDWCQQPIAEDRDWHIIKRPISCAYVYNHVARVGGYAAHVEQLPVELLTLRELYDPAFLKRFAWWWLKRRGKSTSGVKDILGVMLTIANHWPPEQRRRAGMAEAQMDAARIQDLLILEGIRKLFMNLPPDQAVLDKDAQWLPLEELFLIGEHAHPLNKARLAQSAFAREMARHIADPTRYLRPGASLHWTASHVGLSLMLRLWVHRPLRQRNMRDMKLGKHLVSQANGGYLIRFKGLELKVDRRHRQENKWEEPFPQCLLPALADWLTVWRPRIAPPECPYVFVTKGGKQWSDNNLAAAISKLTWQFTQHRPGGPIGTSPHMIRTIWRTEMCKAGMDIMTASRLLGDSIATIHKHYSHVDHRTPISQWTRDLVKAIVEGID